MQLEKMRGLSQNTLFFFLSKLLMLFQFCFLCKADNPLIVTKQIGTMITVKTTCTNNKCGWVHKWYSQPNVAGTEIPAGNFLLSFATLCAGGSFTKVKHIFGHMGLACTSLSTYFVHQKVLKLTVSIQHRPLCTFICFSWCPRIFVYKICSLSSGSSFLS